MPGSNATPVFSWPYANRFTDGLTYGIVSGEDALLAIEGTVSGINTRLTAEESARAKGFVTPPLSRVTNATNNGTPTETGVARYDDIPVIAGRSYLIYTSALNMSPSVAGLSGELRCRITTDGTTPSASSTQIASAQIEATAGFVPRDSTILLAEVTPGSNYNLSIWFGWALIGGAGTVTLQASATSPLKFFVEDKGVPGTTIYGTVL